jgi:Protein of unknown function (DUF4245)
MVAASGSDRLGSEGSVVCSLVRVRLFWEDRTVSDEAGVRESPSAAPRSGRPPSTPGALLAAMLVLLMVIGAFVGLRSLLREQVEVTPTSVDYLAAVEGAQANGLEIHYPASLPDGWIVTSIEVPAVADQPWTMGMLTGDGRFVGLLQQPGDPLEVSQGQLGSGTKLGPEIDVPAVEINRWRTVEGETDVAGDDGLVSEVEGGSLLLYGSAGADALGLVAEQIVSAPVSALPLN